MTRAVDSVLECFFFFCFFHMQVLHYLIVNVRLSISPYLPSFASHVFLVLSEFLNHNLCSFSSVEKLLFFFLIILCILILYLLHILQIHFPVWHLIMCCPTTINFDLSNLPNIFDLCFSSRYTETITWSTICSFNHFIFCFSHLSFKHA